MKVCFIRTPQKYLVRPRAQAPLGLLYVAAKAKECGAEVIAADTAGMDFNLAEKTIPKADIYAFSATALDYLDAEKVASLLKTRRPGSKIILGGPIYLSPEFVNFKIFDSLIVGEGESIINDVLLDYEKNDYKAIYHSKSLPIDTIPLPARDIWPSQLGESIFGGSINYYEGGSTVIMTSRGCPHRCAFCAAPTICKRKVRFRKIDTVIEEMEVVVINYGIRQFRFSDDNITTNRERIEEFCSRIIASDILGGKIAWRCSIRVRPNDSEMFKLMRAAGCREVALGMESADQDVLDFIKKDISLEDALTCIENARNANIVTRVLLMVGTPGETTETFKKNIKFLLGGIYDLIAMTVFVPYPGCDIWENPQNYRCEIVNRDLSTYNLYYYNSMGIRDVKPYVKLWDFDYDLMSEHISAVRMVANAMGKLNKG